MALLGFLFMVLLGGVNMWIVGKFSGDPPGLAECFVGAAVVEFVALFNVSFISFIALFVVMMNVAHFQGIAAFTASMLYAFLRAVLLLAIVASIMA